MFLEYLELNYIRAFMKRGYITYLHNDRELFHEVVVSTSESFGIVERRIIIRLCTAFMKLL